MTVLQKLRADIRHWPVGLLIALTVVLAIFFINDMSSLKGGLVTRIGLVLAYFACTCVIVGFAVIRREREQRAVQRYIDLLCRLDHHDLTDDIPAQAMPSLHANNPWRGTFNRIFECLKQYAAQIHESEQARARAEVRSRRLSSERAQITQILDGLSDPVLAIDRYDELILSNPSAAQLFELPEDSAEKQALETLIHCESLVGLLTETRRRKGASHRSAEIELAGKDGETRCYRVSCRSIGLDSEEDAEDPGQQGAVAVLADISNEKVIQKRNAEFVSAVSHEMKTPLSGIKAYVELLVDGDAETDEEREEFLSVIDSQADRLQRLVNNLLNIARIEAGVVQVSKEAQSLNELLEGTVGVVAPSAEQKNIELKVELSPMYLGVLADRDMLAQAAINLLSNAIKYTPNNGTVTLRSRMEDNEVVFEVQDTGVGLDADDCNKVFEKFYRVKKDSQMAAGTGLGLPLCKHIVEDVHGGHLSVTSELGKGSTFRAVLPSVKRMGG